MNITAITVLGTDRLGIINTITRYVSHCGCNIEDNRLTLSGKEFTFIMLLPGLRNSMILLEFTLTQKGVDLDLLIYNKTHNAAQTAAHSEHNMGQSKD